MLYQNFFFYQFIISVRGPLGQISFPVIVSAFAVELPIVVVAPGALERTVLVILPDRTDGNAPGPIVLAAREHTGHAYLAVIVILGTT